LASWRNPWVVSFPFGSWVRKDAYIFVVTLCIDTFTIFNIFLFYTNTNRCPSLWGIRKPPWSLCLNLCLEFTAWLRCIIDNCMCGKQRWGSISKITLHNYCTMSEYMQLLCALLITFLLINIFRLTITKGLNTYWLKTFQLWMFH
jgi:hypothetical protein